MAPNALATLTIDDLAHLYEVFTAAHAAFVSIESMPHSYDALSASASHAIDEEISRCGSTQNQITRELVKRQPKSSREQEIMRATLLIQRAGEDIREVLHVRALTTGPLIATPRGGVKAAQQNDGFLGPARKGGAFFALAASSHPFPASLKCEMLSFAVGRQHLKAPRKPREAKRALDSSSERVASRIVVRPAALRQAGLFDLPPTWIAPCTPTLVRTAPAGPNWLHEIKHDGYRTVCVVDGGGVSIHTRQGHDWASRMPSIARALEEIAY